MRGITAVRANSEYQAISAQLDKLLDDIPQHSPHLLLPEANVLHYLKAIRYARTESRGRFVSRTYDNARSSTVRRGCIECWHLWRDRHRFISLRNVWQNLGADEQRMFWLAAADFKEEGDHALRQLRTSTLQSWLLGVESGKADGFPSIYMRWCEDAKQA
jgi:hypothetical protein